MSLFGGLKDPLPLVIHIWSPHRLKRVIPNLPSPDRVDPKRGDCSSDMKNVP